MKTILIVCDRESLPLSTSMELSKALCERGFDPMFLSVVDAPEPVKVIDLANLPTAEIEEIRALCAKAVDG